MASTWRTDYVDTEEFALYLGVDGYDPVTDPIEPNLALAIGSASRAVDLATNRQFGNTGAAVARYYRSEYDGQSARYIVDIDDIQSITGLVVKSSIADAATYTTTHTNYRLYPWNALADGKPYTRLVFGSSVSVWSADIEVTANFGWTAIPDTIKNATLLQASRFYKRKDAPFGIAGSPDMGSELRLLAKVDPDVKVMLQPYVRWWGAVGSSNVAQAVW